MISNPWYFRDALARIRTGWRIRWVPKMISGQISPHGEGVYVVFGPFGDVGLCEDASHALAYYMLQCQLGPQVPLKPTFRGILPLERDDDVAIVDGEHQEAVYNGTPRGP